jgi:hypothetical protein
MTSMKETAGRIGRADKLGSTTIMRAYRRFFRRYNGHRPRRTLDQLLLTAFGSISPAYLF